MIINKFFLSCSFLIFCSVAYTQQIQKNEKGERSTVRCAEIIQSCGNTFSEFAKDFIVKPERGCTIWHGACNSENSIWREGTVGIGVLNSVGRFSGAYYDWAKLGVVGGITTEQLRICANSWCDFVFSDTFYLTPLSKVNDFVKNRRHLPGCVSATVIQSESGYDLFDIIKQQQQKIEEIHLYLFNLNNRLLNISSKVDQINSNATKIGNYTSIIPKEYNLSKKVKLGDPPTINCFQMRPVDPTGSATGVIGIEILTGTKPLTIQWSGPGGSNGIFQNTPCDATFLIKNKIAGPYNITVQNSFGAATCQVNITDGKPFDCSFFSDQFCKDALFNFLKSEFNNPNSENCKQWEGPDCSYSSNIYRLGSVGIGISDISSGYSLAVKGGITSDKFFIELCESGGWCDYVFEPDYQLPSLTEIEGFVKEKRCLPGVSSEFQILKDGSIEIGKIKIMQQEKIEEAYLHIVNLNERKEQLKFQINELNN